MKKKRTSVEHLYIKNMVCDRCIRVVREELSALGHDVRTVVLGEVQIGGPVSAAQRTAISAMLVKNGFELIEDRNARTIEEIKTAIIRLVHHDHDAAPMRKKYSEYIADAVGRDYHSLSVLFSAVENITIEQYIIRQKIERVKELIRYDDRSLSEIAYMMRYSSVQHLSTQFKSVTGFTPSEFKRLSPSHHHHRMPIDRVH
ncbi:MAG: helix-turn-helix domain-containing protein [Bacteroidetes bacterium]|nr:helix-turn-helix domain-containing protein [Bacteroidota bacterium]